ncbi:unnamed protein product [Cuscuta europaea]|uniref:Uncharacterized protein n=1 Tax=Cuscuta europaea TaxID=41803 RepID=A0A9P0ZVA4_CUSEU|nr:unnamed protein product [Cuscuta europaea]
MARTETVAAWAIAAGNAVAAIFGIFAWVAHVPPKVDTVIQVIEAIGIGCALIALICLGCQTSRKSRLSPCCLHGLLYWIIWLLTIAGGLSVVLRILIGVGILFCFSAAVCVGVFYRKKAPDSS